MPIIANMGKLAEFNDEETDISHSRAVKALDFRVGRSVLRSGGHDTNPCVETAHMVNARR